MRSILSRIREKTLPYRWLRHMLKHDKWRAEEMWNSRFSFSQFGEDVVLQTLLGPNEAGFYVDVGAFHPIQISNTYLFYRKGWRGINIEPNPISFESFLLSRPRDINLNLGVSSEYKQLDFLLDGAKSQIITKHAKEQFCHSQGDTTVVDTAPLREILGKHLPKDQAIDFLTIDCEGHDLVVLQSNDWTEDRFRPDVVVVEGLAQSTRLAIVEFMQSREYYFFCKLGLSLFFLEKQMAAQQLDLP